MRISVILPTYGREMQIREALDSILAQSRPADEIIVVDDGSPGDLAAALAPYGNRIILKRQENTGVAAARNRGIALSSGDWLTFLDSDDLWPPNRLAVLERDLDTAQPDIVAHLGNVRYTGENHDESLFAIKGITFPAGRAERVSDPLPLVISGMTLQGAAIRRTAFAAAGRFDETMRMLSDTAFFCQLALKGPFLVTGDMLAEIRRLPGDRQAVTSLRRTKGSYAQKMHVHFLEKLLARPLTRDQERLVSRRLSGACFLLARELSQDDRTTALHMLGKSARMHPLPLLGWLKAAIAAGLGQTGYRLLLARHDMLDRS